jgi:hypothetical protein
MTTEDTAPEPPYLVKTVEEERWLELNKETRTGYGCEFYRLGRRPTLENSYRQPPTCETAPSRTRKGPQLTPELQLPSGSPRSIHSRVNFPRIT